VERWRKTRGSGEPPETPVVLTLEGPHGPIIHAVTDAAAERGARPGTRLTDARAIDPELAAVPADPDGDAALVERLANWAMRWSPLVEVDPPDGLRLDIGGSAHLFGGEAKLLEDMQRRFAAMGLSSRVAVAPTAGAAWALSRYGAHHRIRCERDVAAALAELPVAALRLPPQAVRTLERLGLKTVEALSGIERRSLARRFRNADNPVDALDRALGRVAEPLTAHRQEAVPRTALRLREPVADPSAGERALDILVPRLVRALESRRLGARRLTLAGYRVDGSIAAASAGTSIATRDPGHIRRLLAEKAATLDPGFGFDGFVLEASWAEPLDPAQEQLVGAPDLDGDLARLVDRLSVKLGPEQVRRPLARESHVPERASGWQAANGAGQAAGSAGPVTPPGAPMRPQRLLDRPEAIAVIYATPEGMPRRFVWRRAVHDIAKVQGPERIAPEWWRERSTARLRDYYRVEDTAGRRFWIFREGVIGDGRGGLPTWYLHGLFG
jgi:protein ImuB